MATVLVVDDQMELRTLFQRVVEHQGHAVFAVGNGQDALRHIETSMPDLVLLDLAMPQMDGLTFLRAFRGRAGSENIPVIMLSGLMTPEQVTAARELGVADQLVKGEFSTRDLRARIAKFISPVTAAASNAA